MAHAYTRYDIVTENDEDVEVFFETNDDKDTGYPSTFATDVLHYTGSDALEKALKHTGKSRQGVGHKVIVYLDGKRI